MAAITCNTAQYITAGAPYTQPQLNPPQQKALLLYAMTILLQGLAGSDYTNALATTLLSDASQIACGMTPDQVTAATIAVWFTAAYDQAGTTPATLTTQLDKVKCLVNAPPDLMDKALLMLQCKILAANGY